jgi:hypothetical protein
MGARNPCLTIQYVYHEHDLKHPKTKGLTARCVMGAKIACLVREEVQMGGSETHSMSYLVALEQ